METRLEPKLKPRVFVGSSTEGRIIAEYVQLGLGDEVEATLWCQGVFGLSKGPLEELVEALRAHDFAVFVLTPDDLSSKRRVEASAPRDNVIFDLGMFIGALGRNRTFAVSTRDEPLELPSDFAGITMATYSSRQDGNLQAALGPACTLIKTEIRRTAAPQSSVVDRPTGRGRRRTKVARRRRRRSLGVAQTAGPLSELRIVDISSSGALLETEGEIPIGQFLTLNLYLENGATALVKAKVVRIQYPGWGKVGGVGVEFTGFDGRSEEIIKDYTASGADAFDQPPPDEGGPEGDGAA